MYLEINKFEIKFNLNFKINPKEYFQLIYISKKFHNIKALRPIPSKTAYLILESIFSWKHFKDKLKRKSFFIQNCIFSCKTFEWKNEHFLPYASYLLGIVEKLA